MGVDLSAEADRTPQGIAASFARAISSGTLQPGDRMPTVRDVAGALGVSPATVSAAWQALRRTGLVVSRGRAGSYVAETPRGWLSPRQRGMLGAEPSDLRLDLSRGIPDATLLPSLGPALGRASALDATTTYQAEPVLPELREALSRAWPYPPEMLTVVDGATDAVARCLEQTVSYGDRVVVESPSFPPFFDLVESLGGELVPVGMDHAGIVPAQLRAALRTRPAVLVLQPRAHNPTGISMTAERAVELAAVLRRAPGGVPWVVEDDHSGPISTSPQVSLGTHLPERVLHVRSFSKSHGPDLRIAALGGPAELLEPLVARRMLGPGWTSRMIQHILLDLLGAARSMDEVAEARRQYHARQRTLVTALAERGVHLLERGTIPDGINLWVGVRDEREALLHLAASDIRAAAGSPFFPTTAAQGAEQRIRVTGGMVRPADVALVADAIATAAELEPR